MSMHLFAAQCALHGCENTLTLQHLGTTGQHVRGVLTFQNFSLTQRQPVVHFLQSQGKIVLILLQVLRSFSDKSTIFALCKCFCDTHPLGTNRPSKKEWNPIVATHSLRGNIYISSDTRRYTINTFLKCLCWHRINRSPAAVNYW